MSKRDFFNYCLIICFIMEFRFDAMFCSNLGNANSNTDNIKYSRGLQVSHPWFITAATQNFYKVISLRFRNHQWELKC